MSLLADDFSRPTRDFLLHKKSLISINAFPQKDDPRRRVFPEAKLSTCIFVVNNGDIKNEIVIRTHPGRYIEINSKSYTTTSEELSRIFRRHVAVPTVSDDEWKVLKHAFEKNGWPSLSDVAEIYVGEVFDNAPNKKFLSDEPVGPSVLRGANIDRYLLREVASQGKNRYLREKLFLKEKKRAIKLTQFLKEWRIGLQRGAAVDNWRRLIACPIPGGNYCFDTVILVLPKKIDLYVLLALLNSDLWEWRFRCTSSTNHVNEYELIDFVIPPCLVDEETREFDVLKKMVGMIVDSTSIEVRRSDKQKIAHDSLDLQIDEIIFKIYDLHEDDIAVIRKSLGK
jgi:hypothetical protein